jgi:hypothetical protein
MLPRLSITEIASADSTKRTVLFELINVEQNRLTPEIKFAGI